ncbi:hypothetical protein AGDE_10043 [Angomonas deanei]|uniref:PH domain-containing protein n=1 Tax=Angomonas deanei TaxID=59799 RepID=A0A7G2C2M7_9TRYP|nr:hypothetical protein AGDE_10043 [Angomonas deanei]CAD2212983.1 hypothetical protein, conserved [Angomonas deanei]|eukprot:EPY29264.1 hypothetical protein AGDE_10043 [Angomonas deanei]
MDIMSSVTNPKATWRAAANPPVAENTAQHPLEVVGRLRCLFTRSDHKKRLSGYKKRFWVVNVADGTLDMYKNDQEHVPIIRFKASSLRGVVFSWDKQNRFYVMQLQTRLDYSVVFRMSSFEERELWSNAITKLIERYAAVNRRGNVYAHIVKRCAAAAKHFDVNISVDPSQHVLTDFPEHFLQFVPEAVDAALLVVSTLVSTYKDDTRAPIHYTLDISAQPGREVNPAELGPRYNPEKGGVILNVALFRNASGKVDFYTTSASDVDNLLSSNVFRNPLVEGWIENSRDIRRVCQEIRSLLSTPKTPLTITFEWSGTVSDGSVVEGYLRRHLGQDFFQDILATIYRAINDLQQIVQMELFKDLTLLNKDSSFSNMVAANKPSSSAGRPGSPLHSPRESKSRYAHSRSASANMAAAGPFSPVLMVTGGGANRGSSDAHHAAVSLIAENTSGISILLKSNEVEGDIGPPEVTCTRVYDFYQRNSPGLLLIKYCSEVFSLDMTVDVSLKEDVFLIGYNAFLSVLSTTWRAKFRSMFEKKVTVSIDWKSFLLSIKNEGGVIAAAELPQMMSVVFEALYSRFLHTTQHLSQPFSNDPDENNLLMDNFLNVFYSCVRYIRVVCVTSREKADGYGVTVQDGILTDTWVCSMHDPLTQSMRAGATATSTVATKLKLGNGSSVFISPVCTRLGSWVEQYFSMEANCIATDPASIPFVDEYYYDMNEINDGEEDAIPIDLGDAVALERGAEMGMLNLRRVVNVVYDSQDGCVTDLKVSAELIRTVALHFRKELGMAFHDVQRVLISNLARLRILYSRGADIESREELTYEGAMQLLKDYCEYEESEKLIKGVLPNRARDSNNTSFSTVPDNTYPFKTVCAKSLLHLFPSGV